MTAKTAKTRPAAVAEGADAAAAERPDAGFSYSRDQFRTLVEDALALANGLTPTRMALAYCYTKWQVASTIIGVTTLAQLDENLAAWRITLAPELLAAVDRIRWELRDPAQ